MSRSTIRAAVVTAVKTVSALENRVYTGKHDAFQSDLLPAATVVIADESLTPAGKATARRTDRVASCVIDVFAAQTSTTDVIDGLDTLVDAIEAALIADPTLGATAHDSVVDTISWDLSDLADTDYARATFLLAIRYQTTTAA